MTCKSQHNIALVLRNSPPCHVCTSLSHCSQWKGGGGPVRLVPPVDFFFHFFNHLPKLSSREICPSPNPDTNEWLKLHCTTLRNSKFYSGKKSELLQNLCHLCILSYPCVCKGVLHNTKKKISRKKICTHTHTHTHTHTSSPHHKNLTKMRGGII